jgi:hypothetical protein
VSCSVHDAVKLEGQGVPAAVLCTTPFLNAAAAHARLLGLPHLRAVEVPHPLVSLGPAEVRLRAELIAGAVVDALRRD